jgi:hypothetical protein
MRLTPAGRRKGLTVVQHQQRQVVGRVRLDQPRHVVGLAESVARAVTSGPGVLPTGIADAVLRLAFGRGAEISAEEDATAGIANDSSSGAHVLDFLQARAVRAPQVEEQRPNGEPHDRTGN